MSGAGGKSPSRRSSAGGGKFRLSLAVRLWPCVFRLCGQVRQRAGGERGRPREMVQRVQADACGGAARAEAPDEQPVERAVEDDQPADRAEGDSGPSPGGRHGRRDDEQRAQPVAPAEVQRARRRAPRSSSRTHGTPRRAKSVRSIPTSVQRFRCVPWSSGSSSIAAAIGQPHARARRPRSRRGGTAPRRSRRRRRTPSVDGAEARPERAGGPGRLLVDVVVEQVAEARDDARRGRRVVVRAEDCASRSLRCEKIARMRSSASGCTTTSESTKTSTSPSARAAPAFRAAAGPGATAAPRRRSARRPRAAPRAARRGSARATEASPSPGRSPDRRGAVRPSGSPAAPAIGAMLQRQPQVQPGARTESGCRAFAC